MDVAERSRRTSSIRVLQGRAICGPLCRVRSCCLFCGRESPFAGFCLRSAALLRCSDWGHHRSPISPERRTSLDRVVRTGHGISPPTRIPDVGRVTLARVQESRAWCERQRGWPIARHTGATTSSPTQAIWIDMLRRASRKGSRSNGRTGGVDPRGKPLRRFTRTHRANLFNQHGRPRGT